MATAHTETQSVETEVDPGIVFGVLTDPRQIPAWAGAFADTVKMGTSREWEVLKDSREFALRLAIGEQGRTVDYLRETAPGRYDGAYIRVLPRAVGGSVVVMTVPVPLGTDAAVVRAVLRDELAALARLVGDLGHRG